MTGGVSVARVTMTNEIKSHPLTQLGYRVKNSIGQEEAQWWNACPKSTSWRLRCGSVVEHCSSIHKAPSSIFITTKQQKPEGALGTQVQRVLKI